MIKSDKTGVVRPVTRSIAFRQTLQHLVAQETEAAARSGNAAHSAIVAMPEPSVYKPYKAAFGSLGGLFLTSGAASIQLKDEVSAASSSSAHAPMARAANAFIHSQAAAPIPSDELGISESEDTDTSLSGPLDEVRDTASRAFSVASNALHSRKPTIAIVFDPESGIPVLTNVSTEWVNASHIPLEDGRRSISDDGIIPSAMHFMDRNSALQLSAAMGSAEAANELVANNVSDHVDGNSAAGASSGRSSGGVASTASSQIPQDDPIAIVPSNPADNAGAQSKHPASNFIIQLMRAMVQHANAGSSSAKYTSQQFLPVTNGLPLPAHITVEFINVNRKHAGRYTLCVATANTAPLADPLAQALPMLGMRAMLERSGAGGGSHMDVLSRMFTNFAPLGPYSAASAAQFGSAEQQLQRRHPALDAFKREAASGGVLGTRAVADMPGRGTKRMRDTGGDEDGDSDLVGTASHVDSELNTAGAVAALFPLDWPNAQLRAARSAHHNIVAAAADRQGMVEVQKGVQGGSKRPRAAEEHSDVSESPGDAAASEPKRNRTGDPAVSSALGALLGGT